MVKEIDKSFCINIAEAKVRVFPLSKAIQNYCKPFLIDGNIDHSITITKEDVIWEGAKTNQDKKKPYSDNLIERIVLCRKMASLLLNKYNTLLIHGSCIAVDGIAYLIAAPSGMGKSTHTRLWREVLGERAIMVNDDKPFIKITNHGAIAYGSPWRGRFLIGRNISMPLKSICFLNRSSSNNIFPISKEEAYPILLGQTYRPSTTKEMEKTLSLVQKLSKQVEFYSLSCNMKREAARLSYEAMRPK